jgi:chromosome segregation ATPase
MMTDEARISKQLDSIQDNLKVLPRLEAQVEVLASTTKDLSSALHTSTTELRARDTLQAEELSNLKLLVSQINAGIGGLSTTVADLKIELSRRVTDLEKQVKALFDTILRHGDRVSKLDERVTALEKSRNDCKRLDAVEADTAAAKEFSIQWTPWLRGLKWALTIIGGILVTTLFGAIIWALIQSGGKW